MRIGGKLGEGFNSAKQRLTNNPVNALTDPLGISDNFSASVAEKMGMGQFKPGDLSVDKTAFTDMSRSNRQIEDLKEMRRGVEGREFQGAEGAKLGAANQMGRTQLGAAAQMDAAQLADAERISAAQIDQSQQGQFRQGQQDLIRALQAQSAGQGPSLAAMQMDDARQQNIAAAMAMGASQRGLGAGQGLRQIADQTQMANQQAARDAMRGRIAEQIAAREQLGGVLSGARGQDIGLATSQAGLDQSAGLANQAAANQFALTQGAMNQDASAANQAAQNQFALTQGAMDQNVAAANQGALNQFALQQGAFDQGTAMANLQGGLQSQAQQDAMMLGLTGQIGAGRAGQDQRLMDFERLDLMRQLELENLRAGGFSDRQKAVSGFIGGLSGAGAEMGAAGMSGGGGAAAAAAASDMNLKTNIETNDDQIENFLSEIGSHSYDYKDKKWGSGRYISPMAQELERSEIGKSMVVDTKDGKIVDYARGAGTYLSIASMLNKKLKRIEQQLNKRGA